MGNYEDCRFTMKALFYANRISILDTPYYYYYTKQINSRCKTWSLKNFEDYCKEFSVVFDYLEREDIIQNAEILKVIKGKKFLDRLRFSQDVRVRQILSNYFEKSFKQEQEVIVFGASGLGLMIKEIFNKTSIQIKAFCDNDSKRWGEVLGCTKIISPKQLLDKGYNNIKIIIASTYIIEIYQQLVDAELGEQTYVGNLSELTKFIR